MSYVRIGNCDGRSLSLSGIPNPQLMANQTKKGQNSDNSGALPPSPLTNGNSSFNKPDFFARTPSRLDRRWYSSWPLLIICPPNFLYLQVRSDWPSKCRATHG